MTDQAPVEVTNLDRYGSPPLPWSRPYDLLAADPTQSDIAFFLGTSRPDGRPHIAGIGALWLDGDLYFTSGPATRKARNLAANPACTIAARLAGIDLVLEGEATRIADRPTLEEVARLYRAGGWPTTPSRRPTARRAPDHHPGTSTASRSIPPSGSRPRSPTAQPAGDSRADGRRRESR